MSDIRDSIREKNFKFVIFFLTLIFQNSIHSITATYVLQVKHIEKGE